MDVDPLIAIAGFVVGGIVGLTGMGGGALMTPILVIFFNVQPLAAVSSDLVAAMVMKPVGRSVHLRRGTVDLRLVRLLCIGSVPSAFAGVLLLKSLGDSAQLQDRIKLVLGAALLIAAGGIVAKTAVQRARVGVTDQVDIRTIALKGGPTIAIGVVGGLVVGMTSVGSGSLMIVLLLLLYPSLSAAQLVGTDLVQAIPLVASAALGHLLFGDVSLDLTGSLLIGSIPGVYLGARVSAKAPDAIIRPVLVIVLVLSALKLLGASNAALATVMGVSAVATIVVLLLRRAARTDELDSTDDQNLNRRQ